MVCRGNLLVVDDEIGPLESIRMIMKPHYRIDTAQSGGKALRMISKRSYDIVTLDLNMADMDGIEVLKRIKQEHEDVEVVIITGYGTLATAQQAIRYGAFDYLTKPFNVSEIVSVTNRAVRKKRMQEGMREVVRNLLGDAEKVQVRAELRQALVGRWNACSRDVFPLYRDLGLMDFVSVLSRTLEEKNPNMHHHSKRVDRYAQVIAENMGLPEEEREFLRIAAFLHDIGKIGISNDILNKAGKLNPLEWEEMREHPRRGVELVEPLRLPQEVLSIILHHHESYDGGGYPDGLKGEEIPLCARIIGIIDSYDAMISNRPYRRARPQNWVIGELENCAGTQFDPEIVKIFVSILSHRGRLLPTVEIPVS